MIELKGGMSLWEGHGINNVFLKVKKRVDDVKKTLDLLCLLNEGADIRNMLEGRFDFTQFKGCMDVSTAALMGHSFGGGTTVLTLSEDNRFK